MAHTHEFDCKICGEHLDSQQELNEHNREEHSQRASGIESSPESSSSSPKSTAGPDGEIPPS
jgi:hypothetical protein